MHDEVGSFDQHVGKFTRNFADDTGSDISTTSSCIRIRQTFVPGKKELLIPKK